MIFPYLYTDMSLKRAVLLSILSVIALSARAFTENDSIVRADTIWFDDGAWFCGEIADSMFNGYGKMVYSDSTIYEGEWKDGLWDGKGEIIYPDGDSYNGDFKEHEFCGFGTYFYSDGAKYEGQWKDGMFNGNGTMSYADGSIYAGEWRDDKKDGIGVLYDAGTGALLKGEFLMDMFIGQNNNYNNNSSTSALNNNNNYGWDGYTPQNVRPDSCWHYKRDAYLCMTYGIKQIFSFHADFYSSERFFAGFSFGFNTLSHEIGKVSVTYDDETGEKITLIGWDWYPDEIMTEHTYTMFKLAGECGVSWNWFSLGAAVGLGLQNTVRNCRSLPQNDSYYEAGTLYFRSKITGVKFTYDVFTDFVLSRHIPYIHSISMRTGYSNIDGPYLGVGLTL